MKFLVGFVITLLGLGPMWQANAVYFSSIERYWTASPDNSYIGTANQSEPSQWITFKKEIDKDNPLLLDVEVTNTNTGESQYSETGLNICKEYDTESWEYTVVRVFNRAIIPGPRKRKCPVREQEYEIYRYQNNLITSVTIPEGSYEISYVVTSSDGETVFSTLKFKFNYERESNYWG